MYFLICNAGSTSLKLKLFDMPEEQVLCTCAMERIGDPKGGNIRFQSGKLSHQETRSIPTYREGISLFLSWLTQPGRGPLASPEEITAVGFKTVLSKGYYGTHLINEKVIQGMEEMLTVAPAHNKHYLQAIATFQELLPQTPLIGAFETAFHQTMPEEAYLTTGPYAWYSQYGIRKLGYHGASHSYVADCLTQRLGSHYRAISCHLGGSGSLAALKDGKSLDTSFGLSLQTGLPQMSRAGDLDPYVIYYLVKNCGFSLDQVFDQLATQGGMLGISGLSGDLRDLIQAMDTNPRAKLAVEIYIRELVRYLGGYMGLLGGVDAIAFTGGIGENSAFIRNRALAQFSFLGISLDPNPPKEGIRCITAPHSRVKVFVIPANEELGIARKMMQFSFS